VNAPGTLAFVCAMRMEARPLARRLSLSRSKVAGMAGYTGMHGTRSVVAVVTGIGPALATAGAERLLTAVPATHVVVVGITGALDSQGAIGALVMPEAVVDSATRTEYRPFPLGDVQPAGKMWTSGALITEPGALAELRRLGVVALDMETAAVAAVCESRGTPWSVVRVISDRASDWTVDDDVFQSVGPDGAPSARSALRSIARHPGRLPALVRIGRDAVRSAAKAAEIAVRFTSA
jgi:adenosylhomocysteine nucleosidase